MSFENNIKKMFSEFDEGQKDWFRFDLPNHLAGWMVGDFNGKQLSKNPKLIEDYIDHNVSLSAQQSSGKLDNLLLSLWCIRKCHGPIHAPTLYRLTKVPGLKQTAKHVRISAKDSLKPITSWTTNENVIVHDRNSSDSDFILRASNVPTKNILTSINIVHEFIKLVIKNADFFELKLKRANPRHRPGLKLIKSHHVAFDLWKTAYFDVEGYLDEKEYLVYLHQGEEIKADVHKYIPFEEKPKRNLNGKLKLPPAKKTSAPGKMSLKKKKAMSLPQKIKVNMVVETNPFENHPGGLSKFSPKEQIAVLRNMLEKTAKTPANQERLLTTDKLIQTMVDYAKRHGIEI